MRVRAWVIGSLSSQSQLLLHLGPPCFASSSVPASWVMGMAAGGRSAARQCALSWGRPWEASWEGPSPWGHLALPPFHSTVEHPGGRAGAEDTGVWGPHLAGEDNGPCTGEGCPRAPSSPDLTDPGLTPPAFTGPGVLLSKNSRSPLCLQGRWSSSRLREHEWPRQERDSEVEPEREWSPCHAHWSPAP